MKKSFYLYKSGELSQKNYSIVLQTKDKESIYIPVEQIDSILCFSEVSLNKRVLSLLNKYNVIILFFNYYGQYIGRFSPNKYTTGKILIDQVSSITNCKVKMQIARTIVSASVKNMESLLKYYNKKHYLCAAQLDVIKQLSDSIGGSNTIDELLLIEAQIKQNYYMIFDIVLNGSGFIFSRRSKRPPENEVNSLMSFGYALLYSVLLNEIDKSRLTAELGYIHSVSKTNESLVYDIADIYKPIFIDRIVLRVIKKRQLNETHFEFRDNGCFLNRAGQVIYVAEFEGMLKNTILINGRHYSYKSIIRKDIHALTNHLSGKNKTLKWFHSRW